MEFCKIFVLSLLCCCISSENPPSTCRDRSNFFRQDGGLCFEIPPWQHQPVELESHIQRLKATWGDNVTIVPTMFRRQTSFRAGMNNGDITRYMDTVIAPFLDTYHRNIQNSYQQLTTKILRRIKEEINAAVKKKQQIFKNLTKLADDLEVPALCAEERRAVRTIASNHVAQIYACTEEARSSIAKMGNYAEQMITLTKHHMQQTIGVEAKAFEAKGKKRTSAQSDAKADSMAQEVEKCLEKLSKAAVDLGYELDLSLTNARRHNEQSCEKLTICSSRARKRSDDSVAELRELLYQCVYA